MSTVADYIVLMHADSVPNEADWGPYLAGLQQAGVLQGGSAIGDGISLRKHGAAKSASTHIAGYIRIAADSLDHAKLLLAGNPVFEAGGTVEIRELPRSS